MNAYRTNLCVMDAAKLEGQLEERQTNARKMKAKGFDNDTISDITGLTFEEIANL